MDAGRANVVDRPYCAKPSPGALNDLPSPKTERGRVLPLGEDRGFFDEGPAGEDPLRGAARRLCARAACDPPGPEGAFPWSILVWPRAIAVLSPANRPIIAATDLVVLREAEPLDLNGLPPEALRHARAQLPA
jgi:hypothetical protein